VLIIDEFIGNHPWFVFITLMLANGWLCHRYGARVLLLTIPVVSALIIGCNLAWVQSEMDRPGYNGQPDRDIVFAVGQLLCVIHVTTALSLSCFFAWVIAALFRSRTEPPAGESED